MTVEDSVEIAKPQELVYALVRDLERAPEWQDSLESVDVHAGTEVRRVARPAAGGDVPRRRGRPAAPARDHVGGRAGEGARATFDLEPDGDGTRVTFTLDVELRGAARMAGPHRRRRPLSARCARACRS